MPRFTVRWSHTSVHLNSCEHTFFRHKVHFPSKNTHDCTNMNHERNRKRDRENHTQKHSNCKLSNFYSNSNLILIKNQKIPRNIHTGNNCVMGKNKIMWAVYKTYKKMKTANLNKNHIKIENLTNILTWIEIESRAWNQLMQQHRKL